MKTKSITFTKNIKPALMLEHLGQLTFMFFLIKGIFWLGLTGWLVFTGLG